MSLIDSKMARPIGLKLGGMVESVRENVLVKNLFLFFLIQDGRQMDYIVKKEFFVFFSFY